MTANNIKNGSQVFEEDFKLVDPAEGRRLSGFFSDRSGDQQIRSNNHQQNSLTPRSQKQQVIEQPVRSYQEVFASQNRKVGGTNFTAPPTADTCAFKNLSEEN